MKGPGNVLLLGASGFLGRHLRENLERHGHRVVAPHGAERVDLTDGRAVRRLIGACNPDAVVNSAGITSPALAKQDPGACFAVNTGGVVNLLEAIRTEAPSAHFVAISSAAVYSGDPPFTERSPTAALTPYAASKLAMELYCRQYESSTGASISVLRCFNLIGPGEPRSQASSEFGLAALGAGPGGTAEVRVGEPSTARDFTDVRDTADVIRLVIETESTGTFNLCSGETTSLVRLAELIGDCADVDLTLAGTGSGRPTSGLLEVWGSNAKLHRATGWQPHVSLETSVADLLRSLDD